MLIDSNIIIYAARPEHENLRQFIAEHTPAVSAVSYVEVLGYHNLTKADQRLFEEFFASSVILPISQGVIEQPLPIPYITSQGTKSGRKALFEKL